MKEKAFFTTDAGQRILSWSKGMELLTGKTFPEVQGILYHEVLPRIIMDNSDALSTTFMKNKTLSLDDYIFSCLHSQNKLRIKIKPLKDRSGKVSRVRADLTTLSTCPKIKQLDQSRDLINIGKIASTLAHDVRNPLNAIKGAVVYLRSKYSHENTLLEFAQIMEEEIERLDSFISRFLSSSIFVLDVALTDMNNIVRKIEKLTSLQTRMRDINAHFIYGKVSPIMVSPFHIEHAILNITNNALDAMEKGGLLTVSTFSERCNDEDHVVVQVSDTGKGLKRAPDDEAHFIHRNNGKGYGLFVTREILKYFKGRMEIKSSGIEGTTVRLLFPYSLSQQEGAAHVA